MSFPTLNSALESASQKFTEVTAGMHAQDSKRTVEKTAADVQQPGTPKIQPGFNRQESGAHVPHAKSNISMPAPPPLEHGICCTDSMWAMITIESSHKAWKDTNCLD